MLNKKDKIEKHDKDHIFKENTVISSRIMNSKKKNH
jgi:hypothetical protein